MPGKADFNPGGYDKDLVDMIKKDVLQTSPGVKWNDIAGAGRAWVAELHSSS